MMGGLDGARRMMERDVLKPTNVGATMRRFGYYFSRHWPGMLIAIVMLVAATWTQVKTPEIIGQAVDCYLVPRPDACTFATITLDATVAERTSGLLSLVLVLLALFVAGSVLNGVAFYSMNWSGQRVLRL